MAIKFPEIGICGLSCRLCPNFHTVGISRCGGCKSVIRMSAGCPFITCAIKKKNLEYCGLCDEKDTCEKWTNHREFSQKHDTFVCYQKLEENISFIDKYGLVVFENTQKIKETILQSMLDNFNEGRSKRYYCTTATVMMINELRIALYQAQKESQGMNIKEKSKVLHSILDKIATKENYNLKLRK